jgi:uncharacterized protein YqeY
MVANQIDHVLISNRFRSAMTDIRALKGPDSGSDHSLLKVNFKVKLRVKTGNKYNEKRKMVNIFQNPKWKQEYATEINNKFEILENLDNEDIIDDDINEKWENIKTRIEETKQRFIETDEGTEIFKNKWYDEECKLAIEEMKKAREKWLINVRREKEEQEYYHKGKEAHKIIRNKKGELAMNTREKAEIWKEYFDKLLNTEETRELIKKGNKEIGEDEVDELTTVDVKKAIRNLKNNKVAGTDGIHLELIKYGGDKLLNRMYELVRHIWEEERIPEEWKETIIVPIHKRGDRDRCEDYRGISYKILSNIILGKIKPYIEKVKGDYQN